jgi:hypothetical protein
MRSQGADLITQKASQPDGQAELVVHRIGPQAYTLTLRGQDKVVMVATGYFLDGRSVEETIAWLKGSIAGANVLWRDQE